MTNWTPSHLEEADVWFSGRRCTVVSLYLSFRPSRLPLSHAARLETNRNQPTPAAPARSAKRAVPAWLTILKRLARSAATSPARLITASLPRSSRFNPPLSASPLDTASTPAAGRAGPR